MTHETDKNMKVIPSPRSTFASTPFRVSIVSMVDGGDEITTKIDRFRKGPSIGGCSSYMKKTLKNPVVRRERFGAMGIQKFPIFPY